MSEYACIVDLVQLPLNNFVFFNACLIIGFESCSFGMNEKLNLDRTYTWRYIEVLYWRYVMYVYCER